MTLRFVHKAFERMAEKYPHNPAIATHDVEISFGLLNSYSSALAHLLRSIQLENEQVVGVWSNDSGIPLVTSLVAIAKAGGVYLPIHANLPHLRLTQIIHQTSPGIIITDESSAESLRNFMVDTGTTFDHIIEIGSSFEIGLVSPHGSREQFSLMERFATNNLPLTLRPDQASYIFYTSGSAGEAKGVVGSCDSLMHFINWEINEYELGPDDRVSHLISSSFDASLRDFWVPLCCGGLLCIPSARVKSNISELIQWIESSGVTLIHTVPSMFRLMIKEVETLRSQRVWFESLRFILLSGETVYTRDILRWREVVGPRVEITNLYGPTETTMIRTFHRIGNVPENPAQPIHVGLPISDTLIAVINEGMLCLPGEIGEVFIKTPYSSKGYFGNKGLTDKVFVKNPLGQDEFDIVYKTGDLGRVLNSGNLEILGRIDHQIKINGVRVEINEVELAVRSISGIEEVLIISKKKENDQLELVCYYTGQLVDDNEIRQHLLQRVASAAIPSYFIRLITFPLNSNGKVDRNALPKPETINAHVDEPVIGDHEHEIAKIFIEVLRVPRVGRSASFFSLGGTSLKAIQLISRISKKFEVLLTIRDVFSNQTVKSLTACILSKVRGYTPRMERIPDRDHYPLSHAQKRMWILHQKGDEAATYNMYFPVRLSGPINIECLQAAFDSLVQRHESLRTVFTTVKGEPQQRIVSKGIDHQLQIIDANDNESWVHQQIENDVAKSFDIHTGPLFSAKLFTLSEQSSVFNIVFHHIIFDGWSFKIFIDELSLLYNEGLSGKSFELPVLPFRYVDFVYWQEKFLTADRSQAHRLFWQNQFSIDIPRLELPIEFNGAVSKKSRGRVIKSPIDQEISFYFRQLSKQYECSLLTVLMTSVYALLHRYTGQTDIVLGTLVAGRETEGLENLVGYFVNTVPVRTKFLESDSFVELLRRTREQLLLAMEHQNYPFDLIEEDVALIHNDGSPLFNVLVILQSNEILQERALFRNLMVFDCEEKHTEAKFDVTFNFFEDQDGLRIHIEYDDNIFPGSRIKRFLDHYQRLVVEAMRHGNLAIGSLDYLSPGEKKEIVAISSGPEIAYDFRDGFCGLFVKQVRRTPERFAVTCRDVSLSYQQVEDLSNKIASYLHEKKGVRKGDRVCLLSERSEWLPICVIAIWKLRAVYVPVDTSNPIGRVISIIEDCKPTVTIYDDIERFDGQVINSKLLALAELVEEMPNVVDNVHPEYFQEGDISCIFYTSGSSGVPKGVMVRHDGMLNHLYAKIEAVALDCESVVAQNAPQGFAISIWQLMAPLLNGGQTLIFNTSVVSQVKNFLRDICLKRITVLEVVPSYLGAMLEVIDANDTKEIIQHLQFIVVTGEALSTELVSRWYRKFPKIPLVNAYGQTEATDDVTHYQTVSNDGDGRVALGRPIRNLRVYVMDAHLQLVPVGVRGEICIAGVGVSQGYFNNPELTATVFSHNSHDTNTTYSRLYRTGDIGAYRSNGNLDYFGRKDFQVKLLGHRIELGEIENALLKQAGIRRAAVQLAGNKDGEEFLTAFLVADEGLEKKSLKKKLERALPLKMIPARFVFLKELPLNENGKVDRKILKTLLLGESEPESITSLTEVQALLFELWKDLLSKKDFSTRDNFFQLGGHSLKVSRMYTAIHRIFGVDVDLKFIFEHPTIEEIATAIESLGLVKRRIIIPRVGQQKYYDLSHIQKNIWVLDKMMKRSDTFHHVESFVYNGSIPQKVFESVMLQLIMRHDILRSSFIMIDHEPKQTILPLENVIKAVEYVDLSSSLHGESSVKERIVELSGRPFDLEKGPLFKVICLPLSPHKTILLLAIHHLISDGWSLQVMARDFLILLNESMSGGGQRFSPLSFQYQDYAAWHNSLLENTEWRKSFEDYWTNKCMNLGESSSLPLDQERPIIKKNIGKRYSFSIDPEQSEKLEKISSRFGATMFVVFQTIIKIWLSRLTGSLDISVGSPVAGRVYSEFEDQVGPYLQVIPFRDRFDEKNSFIDVLSQVRMTSLEAFAHQLYPLDLLRDRLKSKKVVNRNSFFDVGFTLHNQVDNEFLERYEGTTTWDNLQVNEDDVFSSDLYCDLWLTAIKVNSKFEWNLFYDISLFNETTVEKFHVQLLDVVGHVIRNPKVTLDQLHTFRQDISKNEVITLTFN